jgi:hypothetical protein
MVAVASRDQAPGSQRPRRQVGRVGVIGGLPRDQPSSLRSWSRQRTPRRRASLAQRCDTPSGLTGLPPSGAWWARQASNLRPADYESLSNRPTSGSLCSPCRSGPVHRLASALRSGGVTPGGMTRAAGKHAAEVRYIAVLAAVGRETVRHLFPRLRGSQRALRCSPSSLWSARDRRGRWARRLVWLQRGDRRWDRPDVSP